MSNTQTPGHTIGDEIPYRRDRIDKKTGSLVFDQHLKETLADVPTQDVPTQSDAEDMPDEKSPLKRGQVT